MKICVLVKEVPDAAVEKRINASTGRLDRSGEKNLNPFDTHAIEAAMQLKEGGAIDVDEVVAVTMGPESAVRAHIHLAEIFAQEQKFKEAADEIRAYLKAKPDAADAASLRKMEEDWRARSKKDRQ